MVRLRIEGDQGLREGSTGSRLAVLTRDEELARVYDGVLHGGTPPDDEEKAWARLRQDALPAIQAAVMNAIVRLGQPDGGMVG